MIYFRLWTATEAQVAHFHRENTMPQFRSIGKGQRILNGYEIVTLPAGSAAVFNKHGSLVHSGDWDSCESWLRRRSLVSVPPTPDPETLAICRLSRI